MRLRLTAVFLFFVYFLPKFLWALDIPARPEGHVSDYAEMISPEARTRLEERLRRFEVETSNQFVVATFPRLDGEVLEDFSVRLAEAWKIGQKEKDNGGVLLIFKEDRAVRIEVGYGLEGALPDATAKLIIENEIVPRFREGKLDEGVERAVDAIMAATKGEYQAEEIPSETKAAFLLQSFLVGIFLGVILPLSFLIILLILGILAVVWGIATGPLLMVLFGLFLGVLPIVMYLVLGRHQRGHATLRRDGFHGQSSSGWGGGFGGGGFGGGFSGGGGSFGGGGASGRW